MLQNKKVGSCAKEVEILHLDELEMYYQPEKTAMTERSTTFNNVTNTTAENLSNDSDLQQPVKTSGAKSLTTANLTRKVTEQAEKPWIAYQKAQ